MFTKIFFELIILAKNQMIEFEVVKGILIVALKQV